MVTNISEEPDVSILRKTGAEGSSETLAAIYRLHGVISQRTIIVILTAVRTLNIVSDNISGMAQTSFP
jgi:hypothetical protein